MLLFLLLLQHQSPTILEDVEALRAWDLLDLVQAASDNRSQKPSLNELTTMGQMNLLLSRTLTITKRLSSREGLGYHHPAGINLEINDLNFAETVVNPLLMLVFVSMTLDHRLVVVVIVTVQSTALLESLLHTTITENSPLLHAMVVMHKIRARFPSRDRLTAVEMIEIMDLSTLHPIDPPLTGPSHHRSIISNGRLDPFLDKFRLLVRLISTLTTTLMREI
jgi:hypothetical protein